MSPFNSQVGSMSSTQGIFHVVVTRIFVYQLDNSKDNGSLDSLVYYTVT